MCVADVQRLYQKIADVSRCLRKHKIIIPAFGAFPKTYVRWGGPPFMVGLPTLHEDPSPTMNGGPPE
jgi:hypothetical protein